MENISNNLLLAATNAFLPADRSDFLSHAIHPLETTSLPKPIPQVARDLRDRNVRWYVIGDWNYGEGNSRERAALEPRFLGGLAVVARSFAHIPETKLEKQSMLPLTFDDPADYNRISEGDTITLIGVELGKFQPGRPVVMRVETRS